jgi:hypothetical protein
MARKSVGKDPMPRSRIPRGPMAGGYKKDPGFSRTFTAPPGKSKGAASTGGGSAPEPIARTTPGATTKFLQRQGHPGMAPIRSKTSLNLNPSVGAPLAGKHKMGRRSGRGS